ncbi:hypothetical protein MC885_015983 [Smutsia gigantea]|nr:hypothetical protein MC885_015983 [Smutsia gigantea]
MGRYFKKDCLTFRTVLGRNKSPFPRTPCFHGKMTGHSRAHALLSLAEKYLLCSSSFLTLFGPSWTKLNCVWFCLMVYSSYFLNMACRFPFYPSPQDTFKAREMSHNVWSTLRGIVHKDLKSKNVFYDNGKVVITDFGLFGISGVVREGR